MDSNDRRIGEDETPLPTQRLPTTNSLYENSSASQVVVVDDDDDDDVDVEVVRVNQSINHHPQSNVSREGTHRTTPLFAWARKPSIELNLVMKEMMNHIFYDKVTIEEIPAPVLRHIRQIIHHIQLSHNPRKALFEMTVALYYGACRFVDMESEENQNTENQNATKSSNTTPPTVTSDLNQFTDGFHHHDNQQTTTIDPISDRKDTTASQTVSSQDKGVVSLAIEREGNIELVESLELHSSNLVDSMEKVPSPTVGVGESVQENQVHGEDDNESDYQSLADDENTHMPIDTEWKVNGNASSNRTNSPKCGSDHHLPSIGSRDAAKPSSQDSSCQLGDEDGSFGNGAEAEIGLNAQGDLFLQQACTEILEPSNTTNIQAPQNEISTSPLVYNPDNTQNYNDDLETNANFPSTDEPTPEPGGVSLQSLPFRSFQVPTIGPKLSPKIKQNGGPPGNRSLLPTARKTFPPSPAALAIKQENMKLASPVRASPSRNPKFTVPKIIEIDTDDDSSDDSSGDSEQESDFDDQSSDSSGSVYEVLPNLVPNPAFIESRPQQSSYSVSANRTSRLKRKISDTTNTLDQELDLESDKIELGITNENLTQNVTSQKEVALARSTCAPVQQSISTYELNLRITGIWKAKSELFFDWAEGLIELTGYIYSPKVDGPGDQFFDAFPTTPKSLHNINNVFDFKHSIYRSELTSFHYVLFLKIYTHARDDRRSPELVLCGSTHFHPINWALGRESKSKVEFHFVPRLSNTNKLAEEKKKITLEIAITVQEDILNEDEPLLLLREYRIEKYSFQTLLKKLDDAESSRRTRSKRKSHLRNSCKKVTAYLGKLSSSEGDIQGQWCGLCHEMSQDSIQRHMFYRHRNEVKVDEVKEHIGVFYMVQGIDDSQKTVDNETQPESTTKATDGKDKQKRRQRVCAQTASDSRKKPPKKGTYFSDPVVTSKRHIERVKFDPVSGALITQEDIMREHPPENGDFSSEIHILNQNLEQAVPNCQSKSFFKAWNEFISTRPVDATFDGMVGWIEDFIHQNSSMLLPYRSVFLVQLTYLVERSVIESVDVLKLIRLFDNKVCKNSK